jgi:hypothetical protein
MKREFRCTKLLSPEKEHDADRQQTRDGVEQRPCAPAQANQPEHFPGQHPSHEQDGHDGDGDGHEISDGNPAIQFAKPRDVSLGCISSSAARGFASGRLRASSRSCRRRPASAFSFAFASSRAASPSARPARAP